MWVIRLVPFSNTSGRCQNKKRRWFLRKNMKFVDIFDFLRMVILESGIFGSVNFGILGF
jgi:hypothetical protein